MDIKKNSCYNGNRKKYEDLTFLDDFMFCKVMRNPEICKRMLETILCIEIDHIEYPQTQKSIDILADAKSIRMDVSWLPYRLLPWQMLPDSSVSELLHLLLPL